MNKKSLPFIILAFLLLAVGAWFLGRMSAPGPGGLVTATGPAPTPAATNAQGQNGAEATYTSEAEVAEAANAAANEKAEGKEKTASASGSEEETPDAADGPDGGATRDIGWIHGNCLVLKGEDVKPGTELTIIELGTPQMVRSGSVIKPASKEGDCNLLDGTRQAENKDQGSVYVVDVIASMEFGAAIVHPDGADPAPNPMMMDADEDTILDTFTRCNTEEGVQFSVWNAEPFNSKELWRGTYKIDDEKGEAENCP